MIKRMMLAAIAAAFAFAALPALASAGYTMDLPANPAFTVAGGHAELIGTGEEEETAPITCEKSSGSGEFTNIKEEMSQTGTLHLSFENCVEKLTGFDFPCTTPGSSEGTITTTPLSFHLVTVDHEEGNKHGILVKGDPEHTHPEDGEPVFAEFECFIVQVVVGGNGIVGTVTEPDTNEASNSMTISFQKNESDPHHQTHQKIVGDNTVYNLKSSINGGKTKTASETAEGKASFVNGGEGTLTEVK